MYRFVGSVLDVCFSLLVSGFLRFSTIDFSQKLCDSTFVFCSFHLCRGLRLRWNVKYRYIPTFLKRFHVPTSQLFLYSSSSVSHFVCATSRRYEWEEDMRKTIQHLNLEYFIWLSHGSSFNWNRTELTIYTVSVLFTGIHTFCYKTPEILFLDRDYLYS